jgi:surface polysaccharide O-acyltransferase-like enzyme
MKKDEEKYAIRNYAGFDYIRVFFCIAIVSLHTGLVSKLDLTHPKIYYFIRYHVEYMSVPIFFLISLFLYYLKRRHNDNYFYSRFKQILLMYIVWRTIHFVIIDDWSAFKSSLLMIRVALGEGSPTYFLLDLLILMIILETFFSKREQWFSNKGIMLCALIFSILLMLAGYGVLQVIGFAMGYANPLNFLPYIPLSVIMVVYFNDGNIKFLHLLFLTVGFFVFSIIEIHFQHTLIKCGKFLPRAYEAIVYFPYARVSLLFQAGFILYLCISVKKDTPKFVHYLSNLSLGVFLIHTVVIHYLTNTLNFFSLNLNRPFFFLSVLIISGLLSCLLNNRLYPKIFK